MPDVAVPVSPTSTSMVLSTAKETLVSDNVAVTVTVLPRSRMLLISLVPSSKVDGLKLRLTLGVESSSVIDKLVLVTFIWDPVPEIVTLSLLSTTVSCVGVNVNVPVPVVTFAAKEIVKSDTTE